MKTFITLVLFSMLSLSTQAASCKNYREISETSLHLSEKLEELRVELWENYSFSLTLRDLVTRAMLDASFLHQVTKSGMMNCDVSIRAFENLKASHHRMTYRFEKFASRRDVSSIEFIWKEQSNDFEVLSDFFKTKI